ncbi:MBL fold metallo-hydrolase [Halobium salinum]|uniref:MBL fold metallo-hydrolase n=1 Tax=Halobium salinum TaxID=1364940 RepID=A0ABD5PH91_9EURY|nr:MBL fold metallo-hydrolase [Halobium salinum]
MKRIQLANRAFEGRNDVYLLPGEPTVLVDAGIATDAGRDALRAGLAEAGLAVEDVDEVLVTHWHYDHTGLAGEIQAESGATVRAHAADAPLVAGDEAAVADEAARTRRRLDEWGLPHGPREELLDFFDTHEDIRGTPCEVTPFDGGDVLDLGERSFEVVHLPGHAAGLSAFETAGETLDSDAPGRHAFVGDAILPKYTPNVGGADVRVEDPLATYAESLVEVVERDWARAWPGHRDPIDDPAGRAREILAHHRERTERVVSVLDEHGPCDAWTVSAHLFGDLSDIHILHGPGEAFAHLDHLASAGVVECDEGGAESGGHRYALVEAEPDVAALFPATE